MTDIAKARCDADRTATPAVRDGLQVFVDGCHDPKSGRGGWAFIACRDTTEIASDCGGVGNSSNNAMEAMALLQALAWVSSKATQEPAVIWSDSAYVINGCSNWRHIWKRNGWKKIDPNPKARRRTIANAELWKAIDAELSHNPLLTIAWCKGHSGIDGNERADQLAEKGRLAADSPDRPL